METEDILTVPDAALDLGIAESSMRDAISKGRVSVVRVFGRVFITKAELAQYRERSQPAGKPKRGRPRRQENAK